MDTPLSLTHPTIPLSHYPTTPPSPPANAFLSIPPGEGGGGGKSLHEQLMANKDKKDAEWEENFAASRAPRGLDEEDVAFLDEQADIVRDKEMAHRDRDEEDMASFAIARAATVYVGKWESGKAERGEERERKGGEMRRKTVLSALLCGR